jgi:cysteinyl-tRNA synthetase
MDEDLNVSDALSAVFTLVRDANRALDRLGNRAAPEEVESALSVLEGFDATFGVLSLRAGESDVTDVGLREWVEERIAARLEARRERDYERADAIRREVEGRGIILEDTPEGTRWKMGSGTISAPDARR